MTEETHKSPRQGGPLTLLARIGFGARGAIYLLCAAFAIAAGLGFGARPRGIVDALYGITNSRLQIIAAAVGGLGLACLAAYFAIRGIWVCAKDRGAERWLLAGSLLGDAIIYAAVVVYTLGIVVGWRPNGDRETQTLTAWMLTQPFGRFVVGAVGLVILACGVAVVAWVLLADIDDDVDLPEYRKRLIEPIRRYGLAGRGVAASLVGVYWMGAALHQDPSQAHELGGTLLSVEHFALGWLLLLTLGLAFAASAIFDFVEALYHSPALAVSAEAGQARQ